MGNDKPEVMGKFGAVFGIRGWLRVYSYTEDPESLFEYSPWFCRFPGSGWREISIAEYKRHADGFIARIDNINVREEAQNYTGMEIGILGSSLPPLPEGVYRWRDLIGLKVVNLDGYPMGTVKSLLETGANDVLVVKAEIDDKYEIRERLIPYTDSAVKEVDLDSKVIRVDWESDF